jgi:hypothetical protein
MFILASKPYLEGQAAERMQEGRTKGGKTAGRGRAKRAADSSSPKSGESYSATDKHAGKTTTALAAQAGVSRYKVEQASAVQKADPEAAKDVLAGKLSLREAAKQAKVPRLTFRLAHPKRGHGEVSGGLHRFVLGLPSGHVHRRETVLG